MKKFMMLILSVVSVIALSGCGGSGSGSATSVVDEVNIYDLNQGFLVTANIVNVTDQPEIEIQFCGDSYNIYDYSVSSEIDSGTFITNNYYIDFASDIHLPYSLDTLGISDDFLLVGETYPVDSEDWRITYIELIDCF